MMIDPKNLIPLPLKDWKPGGIFYLKVKDGDYAKCDVPTEEEFGKKTIREQIEFREWIKKCVSDGVLFINRNNPWGHFVKK